MMKIFRKGAVRKVIVLTMMTVFMAGGALTAYAEEDNGNTLTEYVIPADQVNHENVVIMGDDGIVCYTAYPISWDVPAGRKYQTTVFHVKKDRPIVVNLVIESGGVSVRVGVEYPDGSEHYVSADGQMWHAFTADSTGDYCFFVENISDAQISVSGAYMF